MLNFLLIAFAVTLVYISSAERFRTYAKLIAIQGVLIFTIAMVLLTEVNLGNLIFIAVETLVFKAILVPYFLFKVISKTKVYRVHNKALPSFYGLVLSLCALILSVYMANVLHNEFGSITFMTVCLFTLLVGIILIVTHKLIFSHTIGFLVIENGVFLLSVLIGTEMPLLINIGILLDVFVSVLILTIFANRIGSKFGDMGTENLTTLKH